jgi:hypothetical protein
MAPGNRWELIFPDNDDWRFSLKTVADGCERIGWGIGVPGC